MSCDPCRVRRTTRLIAVTLFICSGCTDSDDPHSLRMLDSLDPDVPVIRSEPSDLQAPPSGWEVEEVFRLGGVDDGETAVVFGDIQGVELDADGNVYVLDPQHYVVRAFRSDGEHFRDLGGQGEGPGEFVRPTGLLLLNDGRLLVRDRLTYSLFDLDGADVETLVRTAAGAGDPVATGDGRIYQSVVTNFDPLARTGDHAYFVSVVREGTMVVVDTIWRPEEIRFFWWVEFGSEGEGGMWPIPFAPESRDHPDPRGGFWRGLTDGMRFVRYSPVGDPVAVVERVGALGELVTRSDRSEALEALRSTFGERIQVDPSEIPTRKPLWSSFFVDDSGRLWVERYRDPGVDPLRPREWEIHDADGHYLGVLVLPMEGSPRRKIRGGRMVGTVSDSLGVRYVVLFDLSTN